MKILDKKWKNIIKYQWAFIWSIDQYLVVISSIFSLPYVELDLLKLRSPKILFLFVGISLDYLSLNVIVSYLIESSSFRVFLGFGRTIFWSDKVLLVLGDFWVPNYDGRFIDEEGGAFLSLENRLFFDLSFDST